MKLFASFSEAIRVGIPLGRQAFDRWGGPRGASCALGAGLRAHGVAASQASGARILLRHYRYMMQARSVLCAEGGIGCGYQTSLRDAAMHLNDYHRWTREAIADWLEKEEAKLGFVTLTERAESEPRSPIGANAVECPVVAHRV